jgi:hypothetical protein
MKMKNRLTKAQKESAFEYGKKAFARGVKCIPCLDKEFLGSYCRLEGRRRWRQTGEVLDQRMDSSKLDCYLLISTNTNGGINNVEWIRSIQKV